MVFQTGQQLWGNYQIIEEIGSGGMALVYLVQDRAGSQYAAKVLIPDKQGNNVMRDLIADEATIHGRIQNQLPHPNIVPFVMDYTNQMPPGILLGYVNGDEINVEEGQAIAPETVLRILQSICDALTHVHQCGFCHCDVKPDNIILNRDTNTYVLSDFGISQLINVAPRYRKGTSFYMSPEQIKLEKMTAASDVYSLGITSYEMLTGYKPFTDRDDSEFGSDSNNNQIVYNRHFVENPPTPSKLNDKLPATVDTVLLKALTKQPQKRYQSVRSFFFELRQAFEQPEQTTRQRVRGITNFAGAQLVAVSGFDGVFSTEIEDSEILVGRSRMCDVRLDSRRVSRRHAIIKWNTVRGRWIIEDLNNHLGTSVNGRHLEGVHDLAHNDLISIHKYNLRFELLSFNLDQYRIEYPAQKMYNIALTLVVIISFLAFLSLPWISTGGQSTTGAGLIFSSGRFGNAFTPFVSGFIVILYTFYIGGISLRFMKVDFEELAGGGGLGSLALGIFGMQSSNWNRDTGRSLFILALSILTCIILLSLMSNIVDGIGAMVAWVSTLILLVMTCLIFDPIMDLLKVYTFGRAHLHYLNIVGGKLEGARFLLTEQSFSIGRDEANSIMISEQVVSANAAAIQFQNGKYVLHPTGRTHVYVAKPDQTPVRIYSPHELSHDTFFKIGEETVFRYVIE